MVKKHLGFTLTELMIVVAIIGILAAIAYPSYQEQVRQSRRADAQAVLLELSQFMERYYTENNAYNQTLGGTAVSLPFTESPKSGASKYYDLSLSAVAANTFTLQAAPKGAQATDSCGTMTLTNTGAKTPAGCW